MFPNGWPSGMCPSGCISITTNDAATHFLEYDFLEELDIQEEKPKTWQEKTDEERDRNLRRLFGYD